MSGWTNKEPTECGYYWAIRDKRFSEERLEIVYVYESDGPMVEGMLFALCINSDMGAQLFEFSWWKSIEFPVAPKEISSYKIMPLYYEHPVKCYSLKDFFS